jgi:hypothetical protein
MGKRRKFGLRGSSCLRKNCPGDCGLEHRRSPMAVKKPDPTGLEAAPNVRTSDPYKAGGKAVRGGLPGLGKKR